MRRYLSLAVVAVACERSEPPREPPPVIKDAPVEPVRAGAFDPFRRALLVDLPLPANCSVQGDRATCRDHLIGDIRCPVEVDAGGGYIYTARARCELGADADAALARLRTQMAALARYGSFGFDARPPADEVAVYFSSLRQMSADLQPGVTFRFHRITAAGGLSGVLEHGKTGYTVTYQWAPIEDELAVDVPGMWRSALEAPHVVSYRPRDGGAYDVTVTIVGCEDCGDNLELDFQSTATGETMPTGRPPRTEQVSIGPASGSGAQWLYYVATTSGGVDYANEYWLTTTIAGGQVVAVAKYRSTLDRTPLDDGSPDLAKLEQRAAPATIRAAAVRVVEAYVRAHPRPK